MSKKGSVIKLKQNKFVLGCMFCVTLLFVFWCATKCSPLQEESRTLAVEERELASKEKEAIELGEKLDAELVDMTENKAQYIENKAREKYNYVYKGESIVVPR